MKKIILTILFLLTAFTVIADEIYQKPNISQVVTQAKDFDKIKGMSRKKLFISTLVPIIDEIKESIASDRKKVEAIYEKENLSNDEKLFLEEKYLAYKVSSKNIKELLVKMILPPTSLIIAQASLESGWGSSRIAKEGNNLFGMKSGSKDSRYSVKAGSNTYYKRYATIKDSVSDYVMTISRHKAYASLRGAINKGENTLALVNYLGSYSELRGTYAKMLTTVVKANNLQKHD